MDDLFTALYDLVGNEPAKLLTLPGGLLVLAGLLRAARWWVLRSKAKRAGTVASANITVTVPWHNTPTPEQQLALDVAHRVCMTTIAEALQQFRTTILQVTVPKN
jgi:hypothetical protein